MRRLIMLFLMSIGLLASVQAQDIQSVVLPSLSPLEARSAQQITILGQVPNVRDATFINNTADLLIVTTTLAGRGTILRLNTINGDATTIYTQPQPLYSIVYNPMTAVIYAGGVDFDGVGLLVEGGADGGPFRTVRTRDRAPITRLSYDLEGFLMVAVSDKARLYSATQVYATLNDMGETLAFGFGPNGISAYSTRADDDDGTIQAVLYNTQSDSRVPLPDAGDVTALAFLPQVTFFNFHEPRTLFTTGAVDGTIRLWDLALLDVVQTLPSSNPTPVTTMAFRDDGYLLAVAHADGTISIWEVDRENRLLYDEPVAVLHQPVPATSLQFDSGHNLLLSMGIDGVARLWGVRRPPPPDDGERAGQVYLSDDELLRFVYPDDWALFDDGGEIIVANRQAVIDDYYNTVDNPDGAVLIVTRTNVRNYFDIDELESIGFTPHPTVVLNRIVDELLEENPASATTAVTGYRLNGRRAASVRVADEQFTLEITFIDIDFGDYLSVIAFGQQLDDYRSTFLGILDSITYTRPQPEPEETEDGS